MNSRSSLRHLCVLSVSAVRSLLQNIHRGDAENAEVTQRIVQVKTLRLLKLIWQRNRFRGQCLFLRAGEM
jgi:hypothetical protein